MKTPYQESIRMSTELQDNNELIIGYIYRSPSSEKANNSNLRKIMEEAIPLNKSHIVIMGDFNYSQIDWRHGSTSGDTVSEEFQLVEKLRDIYLHQHAGNPIRDRGTNQPGLLDLILTNEEGIVDNIDHLLSLGKSLVSFIFKCYVGR